MNYQIKNKFVLLNFISIFAVHIKYTTMTLQADKTKRGQMLQEWVAMLQAKGYSRSYALERINTWMKDPIRLRIINALSGV